MHPQLHQIAQPHAWENWKQHLLFWPVAQEPARSTPDHRLAITCPELRSAVRHEPSPSRVAGGTTHLLKIAQDEFNDCSGQVKQGGDLSGGGLFEEGYSFLDEPAKRVLRGLAPGEDRSFVEDNVKRLRGDGHDQAARGPFDLFQQPLHDLPPFLLHGSPAPTSSPVLRNLLNPTTIASEREQGVEMVARLGFHARHV
jgi:hypothetical protein